MSKKLVVVAIATGKQGRSVVTALLKHGEYAIRGLTRDTATPAAAALAAKGVEMVAADLADKESLTNAFKGAYAVFGVTLPFIKDSELVQGRNIVDACKANNVALLVWSSLPSANERSNGKYTDIRHCDEKAEIDKYIRAQDQPAVILQTGGFAENLLNFYQLSRDTTDSSKWHITYSLWAATFSHDDTYVEADLGNSVTAVIDRWEDPAWKARLIKEPIPCCSYRITGQEMADTIKRITGKDVDYVTSKNADPLIKSFYEWAAEGFYRYQGAIPPEILVDMGVKFHTFEDYVRDRVAPFINEQK